MIIIGEKINGAIPSAAAAIENRDEVFIRDLARRQTEAGAQYLDICAGTSKEKELSTLEWLLEVVQDETALPICIDSPDAGILKAVLPRIHKPGIVNSVSGEGDKCEVIYPLLEGTEWKVVALTCDDAGIPYTVDKKAEIATTLIEKAAHYGITPDRILIDPLVMAISAVNDSMLVFMDAIREIKRRYPTVLTTSGLSNISFGTPYRKVVNLNFLALAMSAGMDSAIIDPTNRDVTATILATEMLLGRDRCCRSYNKAYRAGKIGPVK